MPTERVVIVGGGIGGLAAALALTGQDIGVTLLERGPRCGGKLRELPVAGRRVDAGPTVFTMRWVFDELFDEAGLRFSEAVGLTPAGVLARHAWTAGDGLDLYADLERSAAAVGAFSGAAEARRFLAFAEHARAVYGKLESPFLRSSRPSFLSMSRKLGLGGLTLRPFASLWRALEDHFTDPRLVQLFGRYATYCGSSPFQAPATLLLIAHVEQSGVWLVEGGMYRLVEALAAAATAGGAELRCEAPVAEVRVERGRACGVTLEDGERIDADAVLVNADPAALAAGRFGAVASEAVEPQPAERRSLSALAWCLVAEAGGRPLTRHNVFFGGDYRGEFDRLFRERRLPDDPTVYLCAQDRGAQDRGADRGADRGDVDAPPDGGAERLLMIVNAPPTGDGPSLVPAEIEQCLHRSLRRLSDCGLTLSATPQSGSLTTPAGFESLFPGTGGALYGQANHGLEASFRRPDVRSRIPGLYLAGGGVHPGPGVPMAALSGRLAASAMLADFASIGRSRRVAMPGGTSTR